MNDGEQAIVTSWQSFKASQGKALNNKEKGGHFELLAQRFLQQDPNYASKLKNVWLLKDVPLKISEELNLPGSDQGIDLVARTYDGDFWAIQCKYRDDESQALTHRDLATFTSLAFGLCKNFSFALICTSGERYADIYSKQERIGFVTSEIWRALDASFFIETRSTGNTNRALTPLPHQEKAIKAAVKFFESKERTRGKLIMPCGTGKSLTAYWITEVLDSKMILVAVPSLALLRQTLKVWTRQLIAQGQAGNFEWIPVCSDESVADIADDELSVSLPDIGFPCVSDTQSIYEWLTKKDKKQLRIVFTSYQSGKALAAASKMASTVFDLGIFDEAHKTTGKTGSQFSWLLDQTNIQIEKRLFMTATERYFKGNSTEVVGMDDSGIYGDTILSLSFLGAQSSIPPIISDYKILTLYITREEIKDLIQSNEFVHPNSSGWNDEVGATMLAALVALRKAMLNFPIKHAVSYHSTINRAKIFQKNADIFSETFPEFGLLETFNIKGSDPASYRDRVLNDFSSSERGLITNSRCLVEGVDLPEIDCILFADARKSVTDIVQALGRALRPSRGKDFAYIVVPVIVDGDLDNDELLENSTFADLFAILKALASTDDRVIDYFRVANKSNYHEGVITNFGDLVQLAKVIDVEEFVGAVNLFCWDNLRKLKYLPFTRARAFARKMKLANQQEWSYFCKGELIGNIPKPEDVPVDPDQIYSEQWQGWDDWLGVRKSMPYTRFFTFETAKKHAGEHGQHKNTWLKFAASANKPLHMPSRPDQVYVDEWRDWVDKLPTKKVQENTNTRPQKEAKYLPFLEARAYVRGLKLSKSKWDRLVKGQLSGAPPLPKNIHKKPDKYYAEWISWGNWLNGFQYLSFQDAREYARNLNISSKAKWEDYVNGRTERQLPTFIPRNPKAVYRRQWASWIDWLRAPDVTTLPTNAFLPFNIARGYVRKLGLKSRHEWEDYTQANSQIGYILPPGIPVRPDIYFENEWKSWEDWLGVGAK
jgi:superfamily II DNA or RNA helicase